MGTKTLICPTVPASAKMGSGVLPNRTETPLGLVEGNAPRLSWEPNPAPNTDTMDPGATTPVERKLAPFTTDAIAGAEPTGSPAVLLVTPATVAITGSMPSGASLGTTK